MAEAAPVKPRKWRRRLKRAAIGLGVLAVLAVLTCTVGWPWVNEGARAYAHHRLGNELDRAVETLPEISDYEALRAQDVRGKNGIEEIERGQAALFKLLERKDAEEDVAYDRNWGGGVVDASLSRDYELLTAPEIGRIPRDRFRDVLRDTEFLAANARLVAKYDCIVDIQRRAMRSTHARLDEYFGALTTRVLLLAALGEVANASAELSTLVLTASILDTRGSKDGAVWLIRVRNDVIENALLPLARSGFFDDELFALRPLRWQTPGNDPKLWLNNAAAIYQYLREAHSESPHVEFYSARGEEAENRPFPYINLNYLDGHEQLMAVVVRNALDARAGVLDLRNPEWVEAYQFEFSSEWNPINGVVGCGRETMGWIVREIEREDKLWAEFEALPGWR